MDERRARLNKYFGDIVSQGTIEAYLYEGLPSVEDEYLELHNFERTKQRQTEQEGVEIDRSEVRRVLDEIREEMSYRA